MVTLGCLLDIWVELIPSSNPWNLGELSGLEMYFVVINLAVFRTTTLEEITKGVSVEGEPGSGPFKLQY